MKFLVISTSGNPDSNSRKMGRLAFENLQKNGADCAWIDTSEINLPMCDADTCYTDPEVKKIAAAVKAADGVLIAAPVYNFDVSAAAKNMIELTGEAWNDKIVGFLCAAGGEGSYMSVMAYANSLMLDFRCTIVPRFVYATGEAFNGNTVTDRKIVKRIQELAVEIMRFVKGLRA
jgi:NAD(P)H-dependent FMN reductase